MTVLEVAVTAVSSAPRHLRHRRRVPSSVVVLALVAGWAVMMLAVPYVPAAAGLRPVALFLHLAALVLGMGAVLSLDWFGLMWMLGRQDLTALVRAAQVAHAPIWLGLAGLSLSGMLLAPDTSAPLTMVKLVAVLVVALNGLSAATVQRRLLALDGRKPPGRLLLTAVVVAMISQAGWWTATVVGFLNAQR
jgi:hypothetical protein